MISRQSPHRRLDTAVMYDTTLSAKHSSKTVSQREGRMELYGRGEALQVAESITVLAHLEEEKRRRSTDGVLLNTIQTIWTKMASPSSTITARTIHGLPMRKS